MIAALRILKLSPWFALAAIAWLFLDMRAEIRSQDADILSLEQELVAAGVEIETIRIESQAAIERQAKALAAQDAEIARFAAQSERYRAARESLDGLADGEVAPVVDGALEALR